MRYLSNSASRRSVATIPKSPREIGVGVVMPREMKGDMLSWSKVRQTMCFAMSSPSVSAAAARGAAEHAELGAMRMVEHDRAGRLGKRRAELEFRRVGQEGASDDGRSRGILALHHHARGGA